LSEDWKGLSVLVSGASGFIGSHLTRELVRLKADVNILVRPNSSLWRLEGINEEPNIFKVDITDARGIKEAVAQIRPRIVFHLAAEVDVRRSPELLSRMMAVNFQGTLNLLAALGDISFDCFINTGTCEEYGTNQAPFVETQREKPVSPYSYSKVASTHYCQMLNRIEGRPIITLRPFLTYGPYQTGSMLIPSLIEHCLAGGELKLTPAEQTREFNYVGDIVQGYLKAAFSEAAVGEVINLGNGIEYKIKQVVEMAARISGNKLKPLLGALPYRAGEAMCFYCSAQKARDLLGWGAQTGLEEGLVKTIAWHRR
jgi:nucleoside-diphosphate-sugar epimerase